MSLAFDPVNWKDHYAAVRNRLRPSPPVVVRVPRRPAPQIAAPIVEAVPEPPVAESEAIELPRRAFWFRLIDGPARQEPAAEPQVYIIDVMQEVSEHYGVTILDMQSERRTATVVRPRQIAMYLCRQMTPRSLPEIGRKMGWRDHTTILHGVQKIAALVKKDAALAAEVDGLKVQILARVKSATP